MDLRVAVLGCGLGLVEAGEAAIVPLVEAPVLLDREPEPAHRLERDVERLDRPRLEADEGLVEVEALGGHQFARSLGLGLALCGHVDIPPAGEAVL